MNLDNEIKKITECMGGYQQGPILGDFLSAKIHEAFTITADKMAQLGLVSQDERIALSSAIGDSLDTFKQSCAEKCGQAVLKTLDRDTVMNLM